MWWVYIVRCSDNSLYTGVTKDVRRRVNEHNGHDGLAARYTRGRRPVTLVYVEALTSRAAATKREAGIKRLDKRGKEALLEEAKAQLDALHPGGITEA